MRVDNQANTSLSLAQNNQVIEQNAADKKNNSSTNQTEPQVDRIEISGAGRQLSAAASNRTQTSIVQSAEQAQEAQQEISRQFQQQPNQALSAQANISADAIEAALG
jgi:hypothetical protein